VVSPAGFDAAFAAAEHSQALRRIWREVYAADYPEEAAPFSSVTVTDLRAIAEAAGVRAGGILLDLACGAGGPGLWVAAKTGADLVGIDFSPVAIARARARAERQGLSGRARFEVADAAETGLPDAGLDAAMSVDAFWLSPDKARAAAEMARVLRPGGRFVFTTLDAESAPPGCPPQVGDHRPLLHDAGFSVVSYEETPDWKRRELAVYDRILTSADELAADRAPR